MSKNKQRTEAEVVAAENPAKDQSQEQVRPETIVEQAEQPAVVAAEPEKSVAAVADAEVKHEGKALHLGGGIQIPVVAVTGLHYGISGEPRVSITVSVENEDGSLEGLQLHDIPERLIK